MLRFDGFLSLNDIERQVKFDIVPIVLIKRVALLLPKKITLARENCVASFCVAFRFDLVYIIVQFVQLNTFQKSLFIYATTEKCEN